MQNFCGNFRKKIVYKNISAKFGIFAKFFFFEISLLFRIFASFIFAKFRISLHFYAKRFVHCKPYFKRFMLISFKQRISYQLKTFGIKQKYIFNLSLKVTQIILIDELYSQKRTQIFRFDFNR